MRLKTLSEQYMTPEEFSKAIHEMATGPGNIFERKIIMDKIGELVARYRKENQSSYPSKERR